MSRLRQFPDHRYIGTRDDMRLYDCDDADQFAALSERVADDEMVEKTLLSSFAPDTAEEAANRGFSR